MRGSSRLRLVGTVARGDARLAPDVEHHPSLERALSAHPDAAFAVALPPRAGLEAALRLAAAGRTAVVEAPLHDALADAAPLVGGAAVRVAHGWVTLAGAPVVDKVLRRLAGGRLSVEVAGLPESLQGDLAECVVHAMALVRFLLPAATVTGAGDGQDGMEVELAAPGWMATVRLRARGEHLSVRAEGAAARLVWSWQGDRESVLVAGEPLLASRKSAPGAVRALAQLLPDAPQGDGLEEAAAALRMARDVWARLRRRPLSARAMRQSASIGVRRPRDLLGRLGLAGEVPAHGGPLPAAMTLQSRPEPFELWAFRAGIKPVVFLTVHPEDVESTLAWFGDVPHERCERLVSVGAQDRWTDRRDEGEARVELYIACDAELARRAARLQSERDPTAAIREIGALVGYPTCCVEAFAAQDDRANNSLNRYETWGRTVSGDASDPPFWPWELNNLHTVVAPFYPCSYRCAAALTWARTALEEMRRVHPDSVDDLRAWLRRPVLYFEHEHQLIFDGRVNGDGVDFDAVTPSTSSHPQWVALCAAVAAGNRLIFDDTALVVERDGRAVLRLDRTDPGLGFVAPFSD